MKLAKVMSLVVVMCLALAASALAVSSTQASSILKNETHSRSACGQGYWGCSNYQQLELSGAGNYTGTGMVYRSHGNWVQACLVTAQIAQNGSVTSSAVSCHNSAQN